MASSINFIMDRNSVHSHQLLFFCMHSVLISIKHTNFRKSFQILLTVLLMTLGWQSRSCRTWRHFQFIYHDLGGFLSSGYVESMTKSYANFCGDTRVNFGPFGKARTEMFWSLTGRELRKGGNGSTNVERGLHFHQAQKCTKARIAFYHIYQKHAEVLNLGVGRYFFYMSLKNCIPSLRFHGYQQPAGISNFYHYMCRQSISTGQGTQACVMTKNGLSENGHWVQHSVSNYTLRALE